MNNIVSTFMLNTGQEYKNWNFCKQWKRREENNIMIMTDTCKEKRRKECYNNERDL